MSISTIDHPTEITLHNDTSAVAYGRLMIVGDNLTWARNLDVICDFFGIAVEHVTSDLDVGYLLREYRPMAVIAEVDGRGQDGYNVMMEVAQHDADLPMMLLTGPDASLAGAADAVQEMSGLTRLTVVPELPGMAAIVDFLFRAGRAAGVGRMMPLGNSLAAE